MSKQYTFRELIESQLSGVIWQKFGYTDKDQWGDMNYVAFLELERLDKIVDPCIYRIKPKTRTVRICNGIELPECVTEPLEDGTPYYYPNFRKYGQYFMNSEWIDCLRDAHLLYQGMIYLTSQDAQTHYDAIMNIEIKEVEE